MQTPAAFQPSSILPISSVPLGKRLFHHKKNPTRFTFCPCSFADSNDLWQHRQEPSPQVAGLTDAQTPRNNSSRSKSTVPVTRSNPATPNTARLKLRHKWFREFVCLVCPSLRSCWLGCRGENQGWSCTNCRDYIIICSLYA